MFNLSVLTKGIPNPTRAQFTFWSFSRRISATGETRFGGGKTGPLQDGHVYPAGAVVGGNWRSKLSRQCQ